MFFRYIRFISSFLDFNKKALKQNQELAKIKYIKTALHETKKNHIIDSHLIYHMAWAMNSLQKIKPKQHTDFGSNLYFVTMATAICPIDFYDIRTVNVKLNNLKTHKFDIRSLKLLDNSVNSLSCLHVLEHVGLGRYNDPIDPKGDEKVIHEINRILKPNSDLLIVVPVGKPKIRFNAHRIYSYVQIEKLFHQFTIKEFSLVDDKGNYYENAPVSYVKKQKFGCGCFWLRKK